MTSIIWHIYNESLKKERELGGKSEEKSPSRDWNGSGISERIPVLRTMISNQKKRGILTGPNSPFTTAGEMRIVP